MSELKMIIDQAVEELGGWNQGAMDRWSELAGVKIGEISESTPFDIDVANRLLSTFPQILDEFKAKPADDAVSAEDMVEDLTELASSLSSAFGLQEQGENGKGTAEGTEEPVAESEEIAAEEPAAAEAEEIAAEAVAEDVSSLDKVVEGLSFEALAAEGEPAAEAEEIAAEGVEEPVAEAEEIAAEGEPAAEAEEIAAEEPAAAEAEEIAAEAVAEDVSSLDKVIEGLSFEALATEGEPAAEAEEPVAEAEEIAAKGEPVAEAEEIAAARTEEIAAEAEPAAEEAAVEEIAEPVASEALAAVGRIIPGCVALATLEGERVVDSYTVGTTDFSRVVELVRLASSSFAAAAGINADAVESLAMKAGSFSFVAQRHGEKGIVLLVDGYNLGAARAFIAMAKRRLGL